MNKWLIRSTTVAFLLLAVASCTNGKYDPNKSDNMINSTTRFTQDPTITTTVGTLTGPLGLAVLGIINAGLIVVHEFNAKRRAAATVAAVNAPVTSKV